MKLYAAALMAGRTDRAQGKIEHEVMAYVFDAPSDDAALGIAIRHTRELWPAVLGWTNHSASTVEIPKSAMRKALGLAVEEGGDGSAG